MAEAYCERRPIAAIITAPISERRIGVAFVIDPTAVPVLAAGLLASFLAVAVAAAPIAKGFWSSIASSTIT